MDCRTGALATVEKLAAILSINFTTGHIYKFFWYSHLGEVAASYTPYATWI
jgi:hypothetical protein